MGELSQAVAKLLFEIGRGKNPEATVFTDEELYKYFGILVGLSSTYISY